MALAREEPSSEGIPRVEGPTDDAGAVVSPLGAGSGKRKRSGGPRTAEGKQIASLNAKKHGALARNPVVGDERLEDWEAHLAGMQQSLEPVGYLEESLVHKLALNRWQRFRLDRWHDDLVLHQTREQPSSPGMPWSWPVTPFPTMKWSGATTTPRPSWPPWSRCRGTVSPKRSVPTWPPAFSWPWRPPPARVVNCRGR